MRKAVACLGLVALLGALAPRASPEEVDAFVFDLAPETGARQTFKDCYRTLTTTGTKPEAIGEAPENVSAWLVFPWGEAEAVVTGGDSGRRCAGRLCPPASARTGKRSLPRWDGLRDINRRTGPGRPWITSRTAGRTIRPGRGTGAGDARRTRAALTWTRA